jgi:tripartite ATP-independent transporter DctM subunit
MTLFLLGSFTAFFLFGWPVVLAVMIPAVAYVLWNGFPIELIGQRMAYALDSFPLVAVPVFIFVGNLMNQSGITEVIYRFATTLVGRVHGGLAQVNIVGSLIFSGMSGAALADIGGLGRIEVKAMSAHGFKREFAGALTCASAIVGPIFPPSIPLIIYGSATNVSIGGMFAAAVVPGLILGAAQMLWIARACKRFPLKHEPAQLSLGQSFLQALPSIGMPFIILGGILGGVFTPTEAAGSAVLYAFLLAVLLYRTVRLRQLAPILGQSVTFSGQLLIIVGAGAALAWVLGFENATGRVAALVQEMNLGPLGTMLLANIIFLILGCFVDPTTSIILFAPILAPAAAAAGIDPLHFGVVMIINLNIGLITPPLGVSLFAAERIAQCGLNAVIRESLPFIAINIAALALISLVPQLSLFLPRLAGF